MKNLMKFTTVLFVFTLLFTSCSKETRLANNLEGDWEITAYFIDGTDYISFFNEFIMTFEEYDKGSSEGELEWRITDTDGDVDIEVGEYSINEDADEIEMIIDGELLPFDIEIDGDELTLDAVIDGEVYKFKADKK